MGVVEKLKEEFEIEDEWLPFEIHPETPKEGVPMNKIFPSGAMDRTYINLARIGTPYGLEFNKNELLSNSRLSLQAGEYAKEKGLFKEYHKNIFKAYFSEGKDIGDIQVILDAAESSGIDRNEMLQILNEGKYDKKVSDTQNTAHSYDINSAPTFILDNKYLIVGAQPIENFREAIKKIEKEEAE